MADDMTRKLDLYEFLMDFVSHEIRNPLNSIIMFTNMIGATVVMPTLVYLFEYRNRGAQEVDALTAAKPLRNAGDEGARYE